MTDERAAVSRQEGQDTTMPTCPTAPPQMPQETLQQPPAPVMGDTDMLDLDFWNPNVLSTINWLEGSTDDAWVDLSFQDYQMPQEPGLYNPQNSQVQQQSIEFDNFNAALGFAAPPLQLDDPARGPSPLAVRPVATGTVSTLDESPSTEVGEYYVDGEPARLPRTKRRKLSQKISTPRPALLAERSKLTLETSIQAETELSRWMNIDPSNYEQMYSAYARMIDEPSTAGIPFERAPFPPKEHLEHLLALYAKSFHQSMQFLHLPTYGTSNPHWLLLLAMAAIGAHYLDSPGADRFVFAMTEFIDRLLGTGDEAALDLEALTKAQIWLLHAINSVYCDSNRLDTALHLKVVEQYQVTSSAAERILDSILSSNLDWRNWAITEMHTRTAHCLWMLDCMWDFQFGKKPALGLRDTEIPLPCSERLWTAGTAEEWQTMIKNAPEPPNLSLAMQQLYIDKKLPSDRSEFARILQIHGLFHRQWEVEKYLSDPLSQWTPTATKQSTQEILPKEDTVWLPSLTTFTRWQNSACDCLDILHWQANATIGKASGLEHPTVLHLHLARIVLLAPYTRIKSLAKLKLINNRDHWQEKDLRAHEQHVQRWARQCQYKARLGAIHAGVVLWHVRRFSIDAFYEPSAVGLAALMLWAFGTHSPSSKRNAQAQRSNVPGNQRRQPSASTNQNPIAASPATSDVDEECSIILLDRPTDDELVQQFVRVGGTMQARLNGVPDLYAAKGPERVLLEGCKILRLLKCWGSANSWLEILEPLSEICKRERKAREAAKAAHR